jgi:hypothetical protein
MSGLGKSVDNYPDGVIRTPDSSLEMLTVGR